jgi:hypothetical protein
MRGFFGFGIVGKRIMNDQEHEKSLFITTYA